MLHQGCYLRLFDPGGAARRSIRRTNPLHCVQATGLAEGSLVALVFEERGCDDLLECPTAQAWLSVLLEHIQDKPSG